MSLNTQIAQKVTAEVIALIEAGTVPWDCPWQTSAPRSIKSGKTYRGVNRFLLSLIGAVKGYSSPYWATLSQINTMGGRVRKGEKATAIVFFQKVEIAGRNDTDEDGEGDGDTNDSKGRHRWLMRLYHVWNVTQTTIPESKIPQIEQHDHEPIQAAQELLDGFFSAPDAPRLRLGGQSAWYSPSRDLVQVPALNSFDSAEAFASVAFHEVCHSTGAAKRLNREGIANRNWFGSHEYSVEEMIAELGSRFLMSHLGIEGATGKAKSAAYLAGCLQKLKAEPTMLLTAASKAEKAMDFVLTQAALGAVAAKTVTATVQPVPATLEAAAK